MRIAVMDISRILEILPAPYSVIAGLLLAVLSLIPAWDKVRARRRLENAKLEREVWQLEIRNAKDLLELRQVFLEQTTPLIDSAAVAELLASGIQYNVLFRTLDEPTEPSADQPMWSLKSDEPTRALRWCEIGFRFSALGMVGGLGIFLLSGTIEWITGIHVSKGMTDGIGAGVSVAMGVTIAMLGLHLLLKASHWVSAQDFTSVWIHPQKRKPFGLPSWDKVQDKRSRGTKHRSRR